MIGRADPRDGRDRAPPFGGADVFLGHFSLPFRHLAVTDLDLSGSLDKVLACFRVGNCPQASSRSKARRYTPVSDEQTPDPMANLLPAADATPQSCPPPPPPRRSCSRSSSVLFPSRGEGRCGALGEATRRIRSASRCRNTKGAEE